MIAWASMGEHEGAWGGRKIKSAVVSEAKKFVRREGRGCHFLELAAPSDWAAAAVRSLGRSVVSLVGFAAAAHHTPSPSSQKAGLDWAGPDWIGKTPPANSSA